MKKIQESYRSIDKTLLRFKNLALVSIISSLVVVLILVASIIYVSNNNMLLIDKEGDIVSAIKVDEDDYFLIEADNHIRLFYSRFFSYDRNNYKSQIELGINMCGSSARRLYETFNDKGWYDAVVNNDYKISTIVIGEIKMNRLNSSSLIFAANGVQTISKDGLEQKRALNIKGKIVKDVRVKIKNPHGLKINDVIITSNDLIE